MKEFNIGQTVCLPSNPQCPMTIVEKLGENYRCFWLDVTNNGQEVVVPGDALNVCVSFTYLPSLGPSHDY